MLNSLKYIIIGIILSISFKGLASKSSSYLIGNAAFKLSDFDQAYIHYKITNNFDDQLNLQNRMLTLVNLNKLVEASQIAEIIIKNNKLNQKAWVVYLAHAIIKKVDLTQFINKSNKGLSQIIRQDGQNISGGEKQRIGIARALINDPELIILDEATSGLDFETENNVLKTIKKLRKTSIIVSHRLNALKDCDKIYMIENKKITLLKKNKLKEYFEKI